MDTVTEFPKSRQSARNSLRAYLAAYGMVLDEALGELEALSPSEAAQRGAKERDTLEHTPSLPATPAHYPHPNPSAWMRAPSSKPQRTKHARRG
jgi:hypothetical protein